MLSGLLKSDIAVKVNVQIIDAFVKLRRYVSNSLINNESGSRKINDFSSESWYN